MRFIIIFQILLLSGCAMVQRDAVIKRLDYSRALNTDIAEETDSKLKTKKEIIAYWASYEASRRGAVFSIDPESGKIKGCAEPFPEVIKDVVEKFILQTGVGGNIDGKDKALTEAKITADREIRTTAIQLAQKTQSLQFLRESLWRLCELSMNDKSSGAEIFPLYKKVIDTALRIIVSDNERESELQKLKTYPNAAKVKLILEKLGNNSDLAMKLMKILFSSEEKTIDPKGMPKIVENPVHKSNEGVQPTPKFDSSNKN